MSIRGISAERWNRGFVINHKAVQHLMKIIGVKNLIRKTYYRSYKGEAGRIAPNIINRDFVATAPNCKWSTDGTQIEIGFAKLYLSPIIDMFNGEIISWNIFKSPKLEQVYDMLDKAFEKFDNPDSLILHSNPEWQYQHYGYRKRLKEQHIVQSMSCKAYCLDNAIAEKNRHNEIRTSVC